MAAKMFQKASLPEFEEIARELGMAREDLARKIGYSGVSSLWITEKLVPMVAFIAAQGLLDAERLRKTKTELERSEQEKHQLQKNIKNNQDPPVLLIVRCSPSDVEVLKPLMARLDLEWKSL